MENSRADGYAWAADCADALGREAVQSALDLADEMGIGVREFWEGVRDFLCGK